MPLTYNALQSQAFAKEFKMPAIFKEFCSQNPTAEGCKPWEPGQDVSWSGGSLGTQRFESLWDTAYVFAIMVDAQGYWIYRWRPDATNSTGWEGIGRHSAARVLPPKPRPVSNPAGLKTDVRGNVDEAVILQPSVPPAESCTRSSIEAVNWEFGSTALGSMAWQTGQANSGSALAGAHNWWTSFADLKHYDQANYPLSIAGVPLNKIGYNYTCNTKGTFSCSCSIPDPRPVLPVEGLGEMDHDHIYV